MSNDMPEDNFRKTAVDNLRRKIRRRLLLWLWPIPAFVIFVILNSFTPLWFDTWLSGPNPAFWSVMFVKILSLIIFVLQIIYATIRSFFWEPLVQREIRRLHDSAKTDVIVAPPNKKKRQMRLSDDGELDEDTFVSSNEDKESATSGSHELRD